MKLASELRAGNVIMINDVPMVVQKSELSKSGRVRRAYPCATRARSHLGTHARLKGRSGHLPVSLHRPTAKRLKIAVPRLELKALLLKLAPDLPISP